MPVLTPKSVYRNWEVDGVPDSGKHEPKKAEIVQLLERIQTAAAAPAVVRLTKADLDLVTPADEAYGGQVLDDPDPSKNGYYYRSAAVWVRGRGFPDTFAKIDLGGTANVQTGTTDAGVNPGDVLVYFADVGTDNTGPMTLSVGGEAPRQVVNLAGNPLSGGEWTGMVMFYLNDANQYQLLIDAGAAASAAASATLAQYWAEQAAAAVLPDGSVITTKLADGAVTGPKIAGNAIDESHFSDTLAGALPALVMSVAALRGIDGDRYNGALVLEHGKAGIFRRTNDDVSASLTNLSVTSTSVNASTDTITKAAHGLFTGDAVIATTAVNGLALQTLYYAIAATADTFKLSSTFLGARAGTAVDLTGATNFTVKRLIDPRQGVYVIATGDSIDGSNGAWVREFSGRADVRWFGAVGDYVADDTHALQAATDLCSGVFVPDGQFRITKTWLLDDSTALHFESSAAIIRTPSNIDMIAGRGTKAYHHTGYRNYRLTIDGGQLNGPAQDNGQAALNFESFSIVDIFGTEIYGIQYGFMAGGVDSLGAFYINCFGVKISHVSTAVSNGTLANAILFSGGRANDILSWGTEDNDNTDNTYDNFKVEAYGVGAHRVSHTGQVSQRIRFINGRNENQTLTTASGISIYAGAQNTIVSGMISINAGTVDIEDAGTSTVIVAPYI